MFLMDSWRGISRKVQGCAESISHWGHKQGEKLPNTNVDVISGLAIYYMLIYHHLLTKRIAPILKCTRCAYRPFNHLHVELEISIQEVLLNLCYGDCILKTTLYLLALVLIVGCSGVQPSPAITDTAPASETLASPSPINITVPTPTSTVVSDILEPQRPLLMAHYMPWYQTPSVSGYWGWHWTMEHFQPSRQDENGRREIASYTMPLTGPYDSRDDAVLEYQILLMKISGIDGVIVDWYGMENFWDYAVLNDSTRKLFPYIKQAGLQFAICYEDQTIKHMVDNKQLPVKDVYTHGQAVMRYLQETWFDEAPYLKVAEQPVLFIFGPQYFTSASDWETLFSVLDKRPAFITLDKHTESAGLSSYPWPPMWAGKIGILSQEALEGYLTAFYSKAEDWDYVVAGVFPGFRDIY